ncbi:MAG: putative nitrogen fixation protein NifT [Oculatellaceae cyanobacterium Prado106]|jgi:nitrogen fixation protein NifT|nr:putative nitrogen fixation protein NifT [Oculatellaceae cyanobacterium Prado106]
MKVMLRRNNLGHLTVYVAKKDLEEEVVKEVDTEEGKVFTLANGWELAFRDLTDPIQLPQTVEARRLA